VRKTLTDRGLKALRPAAAGKRELIHDAVVPGLAVRITDRGVKTFVLIKRFPGSRHPVPRALGAHGAVTLEAARDKAREWLELLRKGVDPSQEEERQRQAELCRQENSFGAVAEEYLRRAVIGKQRKAAVVERELRGEFIDRWGAKPITDVTAHDVIAVLDAAVDRGAPYQAHNLLGHIRRFFNWTIARRVYGIDRSPCDRMRPKDVIGRKASRQRVLSDDELRALWRASEKLGYPYGPLYRLLLITGQRKSEVAEARWREFDLDKKLWVVPPERMKMANAHAVPLSAEALAVLQSLPRFKNGDHLFSTDFGKKPVNGFSKSKARLDRAMQDGFGAAVPPFVNHDIRRTVRTHLAALPIAPLVAERVIAHAKQGLDKTYNLHEYASEKAHALDLWAVRLRSIVEPAPDNVVQLRAQA
jgi:integrase